MERLQKVIAASGYTSRRKAEELIKQGKVKVNNEIVTELGTKVTRKDTVEVEGHILEKEEKVYFILNKPAGFISTAADDKGRRIVTDLISTDKRIFPVGRLDYDTTGVLILTNDGDFAQSLAHPENEIEKEYTVTIDGAFNAYHKRMLMNGVDIGGFVTAKSKVKMISADRKTNKSVVSLTIHEGKNHQVKRMFDVLGFKVIKLKRVRYGVLTDARIKMGEYRRIKPHEIKQLIELTKKR